MTTDLKQAILEAGANAKRPLLDQVREQKRQRFSPQNPNHPGNFESITDYSERVGPPPADVVNYFLTRENVTDVVEREKQSRAGSAGRVRLRF